MRTINQEQHARQRNRILDTACSLFAKSGYRNTTLEAVATACKMKKASLYHYFGGKDELLKELIRQRMLEVHKNLQRLDRSLDGAADLRAFLAAMGFGILGELKHRRSRDFMALMLNQATSDAEMRAIFTQVMLNPDNHTPGNALKGICALSCPEGQMLMYQFMGAMVRYVTETKLWRSGLGMAFNEKDYVNQLADVFSKGAPASLFNNNPA